VVTIAAAAGNGTSTTGPMHPNNSGHDIIKAFVLDAVEGVLQEPSALDAVDPTRAGQIQRAVEAGSRLIELAGDAVADVGARLTEAVTTAQPFAVGDWITVGVGSVPYEHNGTLVSGFPEVVEVVGVTPTGIMVEPPLQYPHAIGETVTNVPDRSLIADPNPTVDDPGSTTTVVPGGGGGTTSTTTVTGSTVPTVSSTAPVVGTGALPRTGGLPRRTLRLAMMALMLGLLTLALSRRRSPARTLE
jgi:hypothetical protein